MTDSTEPVVDATPTSRWQRITSLNGRRHGLGLLFDRSTRRKLLLALLGSIAVALLEVASVLAILPLIQLMTGAPEDTGALGKVSSFLGNPSREQLAVYLALFVVVGFVLKAVVTAAYRWWSLTFIATQELGTSKRLLTHLLRGPYTVHLRRSQGDLIRIVGDAVGQSYAAVSATISLLTETVSLTLLLTGLLITMPVPTLAAIAYFGVAATVLLRFTQRRVAQGGEAMLTSSAVSYVMAHNALAGVKEIKIRDSARHFVDEFGAARMVGIRGRRSSTFFSELPRLALEVLFILGVAASAALLISQEGAESAVAKLALFAVAGYRMLPSLGRLIQATGGIRVGAKGLDIVLPELAIAARTTERLPDPRRSRVPLPFEKAVQLEHVSFGYETGPEVVRGVDLSISPGTSLALVGPSGAGKSTLVDLVLGLLAPTSGRITVDGVDISDHMLDWQDNLAMVPQEVVLFNGTLAANIAFDARGPEIDDARLAAAVEQAQLGDLVARLPDGLMTELNGDGVRLSGGQRQRVGIARALYRRPRVLVLDEATSALDNVTERKISDVVGALQGEITLVIVAHRLSTVRHCDRLAYLEGGRIEGFGTFDEVRESNPSFAHMVRLGSLDVPVHGQPTEEAQR
ncbi:ABC transporter ATP-binding protein [Nocardioides sp. J2M5]|uniref:ABC transporter ATP-binding protein n=1 Tax=Nocardioides palaemonis TaxID=2829810 RepID=UPI001BA97B79|nr:ABC transporter ATP-binding protein [Nocardioides palaemonis]MBS2936451.1 ABC transporter ATP-binding protein [Nocardioides palaemonis]